jgi:hypothetical protein
LPARPFYRFYRLYRLPGFTGFNDFIGRTGYRPTGSPVLTVLTVVPVISQPVLTVLTVVPAPGPPANWVYPELVEGFTLSLSKGLP